MRSTQQQAKRIAAKDWWHRIVNSSSRYANYAFQLKRKGFTYCEIMDFFAGSGMK